jgi:mycothiol synthase
VDNYVWRPVQPEDLVALAALDAACLQADGPVSVDDPSYQSLLTTPGVATLCASPEGASEMVAAGWILPGAAQARLGGKVHPAHRRKGLGTHLLRWGAAQASAAGAAPTLIIRNEALTEGSAALYAQEGYTCDFIEQWMQRDLSTPLPPVARPVAVPWTPETAPQFYAAYYAGFSTRRRPDAPVQSAAEWISEYADDPDFRPDLSLLVQDNGQSVAFVATGVLFISALGQTVGWISQVAVDPTWRGRGLADGLIVAVLEDFQREGMAAVGLHVNVDNPGAIQLYARLGFALISRRGKYSKAAG